MAKAKATLFNYSVETNVGSATGQVEASSVEDAKKKLKKQFGGTHVSHDKLSNEVKTRVKFTVLDVEKAE